MLLALKNYFSIGSLTIYWYAICIMIGVILAVWHGVREAKKLGIGSDIIYVGVLIIVPISIIGARLWYVLFNIDEFPDFLSVLGWTNGEFTGLSGLAIQGGILFAIASVIIYCRVRKVSLLAILDVTAPGFLIGQICGRWGNFFNQELYGPIVENYSFLKAIPILGDQMYIDGAYRHPVFLYESLLNLAGLILIFVLRRKWKRVELGDMVGFYLVWYGWVRIPMETLRLHSGVTEPLMAGPIPVSILLSIIFIVSGIAYLVLKRTALKKFFQPVSYIDYVEQIAENHIDTLVFDLDGTLLDTRPLIDASFIETFKKFRPDHNLTGEELDSFFGPTLKDSFSRYSNDPKEIDDMITYYRQFNLAHHDEMVRSFPGARDMLKTLHNKHYRIGIVSSKTKALVNHGLEWTGLSSYVDVVIGCEEVTNPKPDPEGILKALAELNAIDEDLPDEDKKKRMPRDEEVYKRHSLYIGDNLSDMQAAHNAGIRSCGVLYIKDPSIMLEASPDMVINKLAELVTICGE